jgi:hypothetical protein
VAMPQAVRCQPGPQREPGGDWHRLGWPLPRSCAPRAVHLVAYDRSVAAEQDGQAAGGTAPAALLAG